MHELFYLQYRLNTRGESPKGFSSVMDLADLPPVSCPAGTGGYRGSDHEGVASPFVLPLGMER